MAYVKITNGTVDQYPYSIGQLRKDNPQTSFPRQVPSETLEEYGVFEVVIESAPVIDDTAYKTVLSELPTFVDGVWTLEWSVVEKTAEEKQGYYDDFAKRTRTKRDSLLSETDWVVIYHTEKGTNIPVEWETYRQALRDITAQESFPENVIWPKKPS